MHDQKIDTAFNNFSFGILEVFKIFDVKDIQNVLFETGRKTFRNRSMPAELTVYYVIVMALFMQLNTKEVLRCLSKNLNLAEDSRHIKIIGKSGISQARSRLGHEPLKKLYDLYVKPIATPSTKGAWYKKWRIVSLDGSTLDVPDEKGNRSSFGSPSTYNQHSPFPQIRFVSLVEIGTHVLFCAQMADYRTSEVALGRAILHHLDPTMLCIADRGFFSFALWKQVLQTGAALLWRVKKDIQLPVEKVLSDGSYLSTLSTYRMKRKKETLPIRVIEYCVEGIEGKTDTIYRLVTNILDGKVAPAKELAELYQQRWEIETAFDELKTHLRGKGLCLRSKTPELVKQEFYSLLLVHFVIRKLMHEAALQADEDPDRLSFTHSLQIIRRKVIQSTTLSPSASSFISSSCSERNFRRKSRFKQGKINA